MLAVLQTPISSVRSLTCCTTATLPPPLLQVYSYMLRPLGHCLRNHSIYNMCHFSCPASFIPFCSLQPAAATPPRFFPHPQVYSYMLRPLGHFMAELCDGSADASDANGGPPCACDRASGGGSSSQCASVTGFELHLVMEYCPMVRPDCCFAPASVAAGLLSCVAL
jgi:hypothetical protein